MRLKLMFIVLVLVLLVTSAAAAEQQPASIDIRSTIIGTRVYLDDAYVGDADIFLDDVLPGSHTVILRQGSQRIRGEFTVKPGELLMLEGRFDESRIVDLKQVAMEEAARRAEAEKKTDAERKAAEAERKKQEAKAGTDKKKHEAKKQETRKPDAKKPAAAARAAGAGDDRQGLHLNILRVDFEESAGGMEVKAAAKVNAKVVQNFTDSMTTSGKLYRSKQNHVLCEGAGCTRDWTGRFFYFDDLGKRDAFLIRWRETVFNGITPSGTSKFEADICVNGDCSHITLDSAAPEGVHQVAGRYSINMKKRTLAVRRADIMKEITDAGGKVSE